MKFYELSHLADQTLAREVIASDARIGAATGRHLAFLAEFDERKLFAPAGHPSMIAFCMDELHLCKGAAHKRITAARTARRYPEIFESMDRGALHMSAVLLLAPYLTEGTADELLAAAVHKSKTEIVELLAARFPKSDVFDWVEQPVAPQAGPVVPERKGSACQLAPGRVESPSQVTPLSSDSFRIQLNLTREEKAVVDRCQELSPADVKEVIMQSVKERVARLEKRKYGATDKPSRRTRPTRSARHIPAHVRRVVRQRDGEQCAFVSDDGHRCRARRHLEFDHIEPVARGGEATVANTRLLCRTHNQYQAERTFGAEFMRHKREESRARTSAKRQEDPDHDVTPWLRSLGYRGEQLRRGEEFAAAIPDASIEERVRVALSGLVRQRRMAG
ncbi:MAG TPA: HNH endonuclease [Candidatus Eisenbacteria bacterium]|nr:HNH endonuclease [Candidatus Eisenbacteria bacterium]